MIIPDVIVIRRLVRFERERFPSFPIHAVGVCRFCTAVQPLHADAVRAPCVPLLQFNVPARPGAALLIRLIPYVLPFLPAFALDPCGSSSPHCCWVLSCPPADSVKPCR